MGLKETVVLLAKTICRGYDADGSRAKDGCREPYGYDADGSWLKRLLSALWLRRGWFAG